MRTVDQIMNNFRYSQAARPSVAEIDLLFDEIERLELESIKLNTECGHLQADLQEMLGEIAGEDARYCILCGTLLKTSKAAICKSCLFES